MRRVLLRSLGPIKKGKSRKDISGLKFGKLTAVWYAGRQGNRTFWFCFCDCGKTKLCSLNNLTSGNTETCGCVHGIQHGLSSAPIFRLWANAKTRAKREGVPFSLELTELVVPEKCPVLGLLLHHGVGEATDNSPSIDRVIPSLGYTPSNTRIISFKANTIKSHGTAQEHRAIADYIEQNS